MSKGAFQALIKENESAPMYSVGSALRYLSKAVFTKALLNSKFNEQFFVSSCAIFKQKFL